MAVGAPAWERRYGRKVLATDILIVFASVFGAQYLRFGFAAEELEVAITDRFDLGITYTLLSLALSVGWLLLLSVWDTRDRKVIGVGAEEYKRVISSTLFAFGLFAIVAFASRAQIGRGYLLIALPVGLVLLTLSRWLWRKRLHRQRQRHKNIYRTLIVGERESSAHIAREISKNRYAGFGLLGAVTEQGTNAELVPGLPVLASYDGLLEAVDQHNVDLLIMTSSDSIEPERMRRIGWELESRNVDLIVTVALTDIAGPRIHTRPISGLPLIHVEHPAFTGRKLFLKRLFDLIVGGTALVVVSPLLMIIAVLIRADSRGPVFFKQRRIGYQGQEFSMLKFRSMVVDAEDQLPGLLDQNEGSGLLFKIKRDPRVTKMGTILRKYSLDELPQLINVMKGEMSLVGPRPSLPREVSGYEAWVRRRLLVKPGITGLWQVSGRSNLSWEDSTRLDLYYVENWSMTGDLLILSKTVRAVLGSEGAY